MNVTGKLDIRLIVVTVGANAVIPCGILPRFTFNLDLKQIKNPVQ